MYGATPARVALCVDVNYSRLHLTEPPHPPIRSTCSNTVTTGYLTHRTSCGRPVLNVDVCIAQFAPDGGLVPLPRGDGPECVGEICISGPTLMAGMPSHSLTHTNTRKHTPTHTHAHKTPHARACTPCSLFCC